MVAPGADPAADDLPCDSPTRDRRGWRLARDAEAADDAARGSWTAADSMTASEAADGRQGVPAAAARRGGSRCGGGARGGAVEAREEARWRHARRRGGGTVVTPKGGAAVGCAAGLTAGEQRSGASSGSGRRQRLDRLGLRVPGTVAGAQDGSEADGGAAPVAAAGEGGDRRCRRGNGSDAVAAATR
ncbi:hypothetical protein Syun_014191 [Stephania yunnanensis]|uniref:Uncharacterized protein n=1 Tax=Stephania yunnanensis TaxID=152371 RepID=A0AAP0PBN4_9MAGN